MGQIQQRGSEGAFERASELLRLDRPLSRAECEEVHWLLDMLSATQLIAITTDPAHSRAFKSDQRYIRKPALAVIAVLALLTVISVGMGLLVTHG